MMEDFEILRLEVLIFGPPVGSLRYVSRKGFSTKIN